MKLYKREIKIRLVIDGFQGFSGDVKELTNWVDEEKEKELVNFYKEKTKDSFGYIQVVERYVLWQN